MTARKLSSTALAFAILLLPIAISVGCRSYHVEITVENHTGASIQILEVDYPSASFGADTLAAGANFHYRIHIQGSVSLKVQYTDSARHQEQITGPVLFEREQGSLQIVLLPNGKAEFHQQLSPAR
jgi:hypothetical protein